MKIIDYLRHSYKDGNNISAQGLTAATQAGRECFIQYEYAVGGNESRTWQTLCAFFMGYCHSVTLLTPIAAFGDSSLFKGWLDRGFGDAVKQTGSNINGIHRILPKNEFEEACANALDGVREVFRQMNYGTACLAFGHSPIIELAVIGAGMKLEDVPSLKELEGLRFTQHDDGEITVEIL